MTSSRNKRIAKNTLMLYFRQLLILFVSLYTVRIVLDQLGVEDYGIYAAVGGLVALSSFLPGSLAQATQRFFSYALGEKNEGRLNKTFSINLALYCSVAIFAFVILQTAGLWFVNSQLFVPDERFDAAVILFHYSALTFVLSVITTPFIAIMMAHEDMKLYAYISILEAFLKLGIVFLLQYISWDKLELYGLLVLCVGVVNAVLYISICLYRYDECQLRKFYWDAALLRDIIAFTGWTIFGQITNVARTHAITLLLNQSFSPAVVAARAISAQIASKVNIFSSNFNASLYPPIIKSYASNQKDEMLNLIVGGSSITFYLLWVFALPMILKMDTILGLWLTTVPNEASLFAQLSLIEGLILAISLPLTAAARAPGKMKAYELTLGSIQIGLFLSAWFVVSLGAPAYSVFVAAIVANIVMFFVRLGLLKGLIGFPVLHYIRFTVAPIIVVVIVTMLPSYMFSNFMRDDLAGLAIFSLSSGVWTTMVMYRIGLNVRWRRILREKLLSMLLKSRSV